MRQEFLAALVRHQQLFGASLDDRQMSALADHYQLITEHNDLLHLVGPCPPEEFATRHVLESLTMLEYLPAGAKVADVGSGGGLPAIPCLIAREDLSAVLIESKEKKASFLEVASQALGLGSRCTVVNKQFAETDIVGCSAVSCRALDKFTDRLPRLIRWAGRRQMLLFGGDNLREALSAARIEFSSKLMPLSEKRYLFSTIPKAIGRKPAGSHGIR